MRPLILLLALCCSLWGQQQQSINLSAPAPPQPTNVNAVTATPGPATYYYWVVAVGAYGKTLPAGPAQITNGPVTISAAQTIVVSWNSAPGATSYDILRTDTPSLSGASCTCAVATGIAAFSRIDTGTALTAYTFSGTSGATGIIALDNVSYSAPRLTFDKSLQVVSPGTSVCFPDGTCQTTAGGGGGGSGTVTSFSAGNLSPLFTSSVGTATTTPALSFAQVNQNANIVFAGPGSGGAAAPTFRALVTADLPAGVGTVTSIATTSPITGGTITTTGTIACATCVTGGTLTAGQLLVGNTGQALAVGNLSGDATTSGSAVVTLANTAVTPASYTYTSLTVDSKGRITAASSGAAPTTYTGTANQVIVTGSVLSTPQDIATASTPQFAGQGLGVAGAAGSATIDSSTIGAVSTDGLIFSNPTAATVGAQKWPKRIRLTGSGWKTTATAGPQTVDGIIELVPSQNTTTPDAMLAFSTQVNGAGYVRQFYSGVGLTFGSQGALWPGGVTTFDSTHYMMTWQGGTNPSVDVNGPNGLNFRSAGTIFASGSASNFVIGGAVTQWAVSSGLQNFYAGITTAGRGIPAIYASVATTGATASIATANLQCGGAVCAAGLYEVEVYTDVTSTGTGTLTTTIGWSDPASARTIVSTGIATTATNYETNRYVIRADGVANITYATTLSVSGTYSIYVTLKRTQ